MLIKDIFGLFIIITLYTIQLYFGIFSLSHPDNAFQVIELVTPLHIVPEWYFLLYYTMLKAIPNKNAGFIILLTSILILLLFGESHFHPRSLNCCFFLIIICFLWIGAQLPQEIFISYGRILTLFYYKIIIYLLFVPSFSFLLFYKKIRDRARDGSGDGNVMKSQKKVRIRHAGRHSAFLSLSEIP